MIDNYQFLLSKQKAFESGDMFDLVQVILFSSTVILWLYCFCDFGNNVTQRFEDITAELYNIAWYNISLRLRKSWPFIIKVGQKPVFIRGVAGVHCTREIFMQVI